MIAVPILQQGRLSEHFFRDEAACKCGCSFDTADAELVRCLEYLRNFLENSPIIISSWCRCKKHNETVGGEENSFHLQGKAVDFIVYKHNADYVADCLENIFLNRYGVIRYNDFTHFDVRDYMYREDRRK